MAIKLIQNLQTKKNGKCNRMKVKKQHKLCQCLKTQHVHTRVYVRVCVCVCVCVYIGGGGMGGCFNEKLYFKRQLYELVERYLKLLVLMSLCFVKSWFVVLHPR